jgi:hypothetical protein
MRLREGRAQRATLLEFIGSRDLLVCVKLDRLGRSTRDVLNLVQRDGIERATSIRDVNKLVRAKLRGASRLAALRSIEFWNSRSIQPHRSNLTLAVATPLKLKQTPHLLPSTLGESASPSREFAASCRELPAE